MFPQDSVLHLSEQARVRLVGFAIGLFFGILPFTLISLLSSEEWVYITEGFADLREYLWAPPVFGLASVLAAHLWHRKVMCNRILAALRGIGLWVSAWLLAAVSALVIQSYVIWRTYPQDWEPGWTLLLAIYIAPWCFVCGILVGLMSQYIMRSKFRDIIGWVLALLFLGLLTITHCRVQHAWLAGELRNIESLAGWSSTEGELINYFGNPVTQLRETAKEAMTTMDHNRVIPMLERRMIAKTSESKRHDIEVKKDIADVLGAMDDQATVVPLLKGLVANQDTGLKLAILRALSMKKREFNAVSTLIYELKTEDESYLAGIIKTLESITDTCPTYIDDDPRSRAVQWQKWWDVQEFRFDWKRTGLHRMHSHIYIYPTPATE